MSASPADSVTTPRTAASGPATGVVVGIDGSASARAAVTWAAGAPSRRNLSLHLVEVIPGPANSVTSSSADDGCSPGRPRGRARALLSRARQIALAAFPELAVTIDTCIGRVGPALVHYAAEASLLVLGSNGPGGPVPLSLGSVLGAVTRRCSCPVVLVPPAARSHASGEAPVLVALEEGPDGERALAFAADVASRRKVSLTAFISTRDAACAVAADQPAADSEPLAAVHEHYPGLPIRLRTVAAPPAEALLAEDTQAGLIVVPSQPRRPSRAHTTAGWTGHFLPILSTCPVAVVSAYTKPSLGHDS